VSAWIIDGKALAAGLRAQVAAAAERFRRETGVVPGLATILVGDDPASGSYVAAKGRACVAAGLVSFDRRLPAETTQDRLLAEIEGLNLDERVDGILVQLPLPSGIDVHPIMEAVDPQKDVDGFHPLNIGRLWSGEPGLTPCTPQGCLRLLRSVHADLAGADAVVIGRSNILGKPMAALLVGADCTVTVIHSKTRGAAAVARRADIVVAATGRPHLVGADWIKPGATIIDAGIAAVAGADGGRSLAGDVDFAAVQDTAGAITPVPGGVGPMTIACLLHNTLLAACRRRGLPEPAV
jgi:methylenetetrahydrofolate dehydrogenase (NADP+)/methenyltetrahydrofolate cyclohydrolase